MTDYIVANCETAAFNGTYEYDDGTYGLTDPMNDAYVWIKWDGNGHTVPDNVIAVIVSDWTVGQPWITDLGNNAYYCNQDEDATPPTAPDDPSIVWMINDAGSGVYSNLTITAAPSSQNLTLTCDAGSYSQTGTAATLTYTPAAQNLTLSCGAGSLALTGTNADITSSRTLICEPASGGTYPDIIVSGAGATEYNGAYAVYGTQGGKPLYRKNTPEVVGGYAYIVYNATYKYWFISPIDSDTGNLQAATAIYYSTNDVDTPDLVTTWQQLHGSLPVPTVAAGTSLGYILTGSDVTLTYTPATDDYTLEAAKGTYTLSGANVNLTVQRNYKLEASAGSYSLTGKDVSISVKRNYTLTANAGIYSVSGKNADLILQRNYTLEAEQGNYALTGADVSFSVKRNYVLALEGGTYNLTGHNVDLSTSISTTYVLNCEAGSYVLTGNPLTINKSLILTLGNGAYSVLGHDVKLLFERVLSLGVGSYALSGKDLGFVKSLILSIDTGDYVLTGMDAYFIAGETTTPACRTYVIKPENRLYVIPAENRVYEIAPENRTYKIKCC